MCGGFPDALARCGQLLGDNIVADFIDINMGCPIDLVRASGLGLAGWGCPMHWMCAVGRMEG